ncbi:hypothetical protein KR044_006598, partial [Drosophila immigrans]
MSSMSAPSKTTAEPKAQAKEAAAEATGDEPSTSSQRGAAAINPRRSGSGSGCSTVAESALPPNSPLMRIKRELDEITQHPPPNCSAELHKEDLFHWRATINGPGGSVYEGGVFKLDIRFPAAYPFRPPQIRFVTRIYHCNVDSRGVICLDVLDERWSPVMNIAKVLLSIWVLIGECNPNDPLVMGIANQYNFNRKEHDKIARHWTKRFATPTKPTKEQQQEQATSDSKEQLPAEVAGEQQT